MKKFLVIFGIIFVVLAIFARQLGIDNDGGWGGGRRLILEVGVILVLAGTILHFIGETLENYLNKISSLIDNTFSRSLRIAIASLFAATIVLSSYFWFIQLSQRNASQEYDYYIELARGFKEGHLYLADEPSPALLSLANPYDYFLRRESNIDDFPWDVSLYKDKFYIYWGPVPALLVLIFFNKEQLSRIGDFHLALVFASGLFIYSALLIAGFWRRSLHNAPAWLLGILLIVVGISAPVTIMLKGARIYEAAIFGCQFFFIGGCYWAYSSIKENEPVPWKLALASIHWAFAVGTRIIVLPAVLFCALFTIIHILRAYRTTTLKTRLTISIIVAAPLVLVGLGLAWYNWARYDSIFEFGLTYQLANIDYTNFQNIFTLQRIPLNISLYFFHPIKIGSKFPFISRIEYLPSNDRLAGLIYIAPYLLLLLLIPLFRLIKNLWSSKKLFAQDVNKSPSENWIFFALTGAGFLSTSIILSYYFVAMRFMEDFVPTLMILTTTHIGKEYDLLGQNQGARKILITTVILLAVISITANVLLAIPHNGTVFMLNFLNTLSKILGLR